MDADDLRDYAGHTIDLTFGPAHHNADGWTVWELQVDWRTFHLGQDGRFVERVLGLDFAQFISEAFKRAGLTGNVPKLVGDFDEALLRASLAFGVVARLDHIYWERCESFFEAVDKMDPWALSADGRPE